jgi:hypothetical protein
MNLSLCGARRMDLIWTRGGGDAGRAEHEGSVKAQEVGGRLLVDANAVTAAMTLTVHSRQTAEDETQSPRLAANDKT